MSEESVIAHFPGASIPRNGVVPEVVEMLERALEQAKDGQLIALAMVKVNRQPKAFAQGYHTEPGSTHSLVAGITSLFWRVNELLNQND